MRVIDADSHFMEPLGWFQESFPELAARCPEVPLVDLGCTARRHPTAPGPACDHSGKGLEFTHLVSSGRTGIEVIKREPAV